MSSYSLTYKSDGVLRKTVATITSDGNALTLTLGYQPRQVKLYDSTAGITYEWVYGMAANTSFKTTSTGMTVDTTGEITVTSKDTENAAAIANGTIEPGVTLAASAIPSGHTLVLIAS